MLDANVLIRDRTRNDPVWQDTVAAGVRVLVPRVAFLEFVARLQREIDEHIVQLRKIQAVGGSRLRPHVKSEIDALAEERDNVASQQLALFAADRIEIIEIPEGITHLPLVERAIGRMRPFDDTGKGGYRDTLLWLTVLEVARQNPDEEVVWVSQDMSAFADKANHEKPALHPHLVDEVNREGLSGRVRWAAGLLEIGLPKAPERPESLRRFDELYDWLDRNLRGTYSADLQPLGFPQGMTVDVTPENFLTLNAPIEPIGRTGIARTAFRLTALSDVNPSPLFGYIREWAKFGNLDARQPFVYAGTVDYDNASRTIGNLQLERVEPDVTIPWQRTSWPHQDVVPD